MGEVRMTTNPVHGHASLAHTPSGLAIVTTNTTAVSQLRDMILTRAIQGGHASNTRTQFLIMLLLLLENNGLVVLRDHLWVEGSTLVIDDQGRIEVVNLFGELVGLTVKELASIQEMLHA